MSERAESFGIAPLTDSLREWARTLVHEQWGPPFVISRGRQHVAERLPGFVAVQDDKPIGLVTYWINGDECELVTLNSLREGRGVGSALVNAVRDVASGSGCHRLCLVTTNDNLHALGFHQRRGFRICAVRAGEIDQYRIEKPTIPETGEHKIPIRDEIELEISLR